MWLKCDVDRIRGDVSNEITIQPNDKRYGRLRASRQPVECTYNITCRRCRATIVAVESNKCYIFWVCVYSLRYLLSKAHMLWLSPLACPTLHFSTLSRERHDFRGEKIIEHKMCVLIFATTFVWNVSHSRKNWAIYGKKCVSVFL
jgi:hypothetical protein